MNWQLTGPRNVAQAVTHLTTRNVPDSNFGPVIVNTKVPSHATKTCRGSTGTASSFLTFALDWSTSPSGRLILKTILRSSFMVSFRHHTNVGILCIQRQLPFRSLNNLLGIETTLRNGWYKVRVPAGAGCRMFTSYPKRTNRLWSLPSCFSGG